MSLVRRWAARGRAAAVALARDGLDALTDRRCPGCRGPIGRDDRVCAACDGAVGRTGVTLCLRCLREDEPSAAPAPAPGTSPAAGCPRHGSSRLVLAGPAYESPLDAIVRAFKYEGESRLAPWVATLVPTVVSLGDAFLREAILVPVPLHASRRAARGFDQAELLAACLARRWGVPLALALERSRETAPQARLDPARRRTNLDGAFRLRHEFVALLSGRPVLLLDDVATTGSTLLAAADALDPTRPGWILALAAAHGGAPNEALERAQSTVQAKVATPGRL